MAVVITGLSPDTGTVGDWTTDLNENGTVTISGTGDPNQRLSYLVGKYDADGYWSGIHSGTLYASADASGDWQITTPNLPSEGRYVFMVNDRDNPGDGGRTDFTIDFVDATAPDAPLFDALPAATADDTPTFTGTAEADSTVEVFVDGVSSGTATADGTGAWSLTLVSPLAEGEHSITATATDASRNVSIASAPVTVEIDLTAPAQPTIDLSSALTNDTTPTLSGTAEANSTVGVYASGVFLGTTVTDGNGAWSFTTPNNHALYDGSWTMTARATDAAGNLSGASATKVLTVDTTAPAAPMVTVSQPTSDTTPTISGAAEAGSTVRLFLDSLLFGTAIADADGNWSYTPTDPLPDGDYRIDATATDAASNTSTALPSTRLVVDTAAPVAPVVNAVALTNDTTPAISGIAEADSTVMVYEGAKLIGTTTADGTGAWTLAGTTSVLAEGAHSITATATDAAGNLSVASSSAGVFVDSIAPTAPTLRTARDLSTENRPLFAGLAEPGSVIKLYDGLVQIGTTTTDARGNWVIRRPDMPLAEGPRNISATATDSAGNTSFATSVKLTVDTVRPDAPVITSAAVSGDDTPTITGTAEAGATVRVMDNGTVLGSVTADNAGNWSLGLTKPLAEGTHLITAAARDLAGNTSTSYAVQPLVIDLSAPAAPTIDALPADSAQPIFLLRGTAEANAEVHVFDGEDLIGVTVANGDGVWKLDLLDNGRLLGEGEHRLTAVSVDAAGNKSTVSAAADTTVDTVAPLAPVIDALPLTNDSTPTLSGVAEAGSTVEVYDGQVLLGTATADSEGNWSLTLTDALPDATYTLTAWAKDAAGNTSIVSASVVVAIDTLRPEMPTIDLTPQDSDDNTPVFFGTAEAGSTVMVYDGEELIGTVTADNDGDWFLISPVLPDGTYQVTAVAADAAGNRSTASEAVELVVNALPPAPPVFAAIAPTVGALAMLSGTAEAGSTVEVFDGRKLIGTATAGTDNIWSFDLKAPLAEGDHSLVAVATDRDGLISTASDPVTFVVDLTAPDAPAIDALPALDNAPVALVTGTAEAGSTVKVYDGQVLLGTATAGADKLWSLELASPLSEGEHSLVAVAQDAAGNVSGESVPVATVVDLTAPDAPTIDPVSARTAEAMPVLGGGGEIGSTVELFDRDTLLGIAKVDEQGRWSVVLDEALDDGMHILSARAVDMAGNESASGMAVSFTIDTTADAGEAAGILPASALVRPVAARTVAYTVAGLDADATALARFTDGVATVTAEVAGNGAIDVDLSTLVHGTVSAQLLIADDLGNEAESAVTVLRFERADENPLVDDLWYLLANPDVRAANIDPDQHYAEFGWREGRDPSAVFSTVGYLAANRDVAAAGVDPLQHYLSFGAKEGREASAKFDADRYLADNADVRATGMNALEHYLLFGMDEGRTIHAPEAPTVAGGFDAKWYLASYADVAAAGVDPLQHFMRFGLAEGRQPFGDLIG